MPNDPMSMGSPKKSPNKALLITAIVFILLLLGGAYYWFVVRLNSTVSTQQTGAAQTQPKKINAVTVEQVKPLVPLFGIVDSTSANTVTISELHTPMPGDATKLNDVTGQMFTIKITDSTLISSFSKEENGSLTDTPGKKEDIKKGNYLLTTALDSTLPQPLEAPRIRYGEVYPF